MSVYFGGSRSLPSQCSPFVGLVVQSVISSGASVHVGCQFGADQQVAMSAAFHHFLSLVVFAVAPSLQAAPAHVQRCARAGGRVVLSSGGSSAPMPARYLLRSIAAFQGCSQAVFFAPGPGSLAVARECVQSGIPVFAFSCSEHPMQEPPAPIPSQAGQWVASSFSGFSCWQWQPAQLSLF